ncbi:MAG: patatin-like phospholipase family protein [Flavobacteriaceae bacterium]|nr:patatin-like phospholipase family protein [Flavobacteriaceae bacterium]
MNKKLKFPKNVSLVLSGGGARGAMHIGVLKALEEHRIKIEAISGTSMGAIIGVLYCQGLKADDILKILTKNSFFNLFKYNREKGGLLSMKRVKGIFEEHIPHNDFNQLKTPFYCCATNLDSGEYEIFSSGNLHSSVIASASIPIVFQPIKINNKLYIDGGLFNNLPIQPIIEKGYKNIIGIHADNYKHSDKNDTYDIAEKVFASILKHNVKPNLAKCNYVIEPSLGKKYGTLDFKKMKELSEIGYFETKKLFL